MFGSETKSRLLIYIQTGVESGVQDNPSTISLCSSVILSTNDTERKEEGRSARETKQRKYLGIRQCVQGVCFHRKGLVGIRYLEKGPHVQTTVHKHGC